VATGGLDKPGSDGCRRSISLGVAYHRPRQRRLRRVVGAGLAADPVSLAELLMHGFLLDFPTDLIQAARIDGAPDAGDCRAVFPRAPSRHRAVPG
jgi:hypothetical protein